jgi:hypothetical protein
MAGASTVLLVAIITLLRFLRAAIQLLRLDRKRDASRSAHRIRATAWDHVSDQARRCKWLPKVFKAPALCKATTNTKGNAKPPRHLRTLS